MEAALEQSAYREKGARQHGDALRMFIAFIALAAALTGMLYPVFTIKRNASAKLYENLTFTRIAMEARQYIQKIEYGMRNGKDLEQFYNIGSILRDIGRSSSYTEGIYIAGSGDTLIYRLEQPVAGSMPLRRPLDFTFRNENDYLLMENSLFFDLFLPIFGTDGDNSAYVVIRLDKDVVLYSTSGLVRTEMYQSLIIGLEMLGLGLIVLSAKKPKLNGIIAVVLIFVLLALAADTALSYVRYRQIAQSATVQSVNRIAQMLQSDVDSLRVMGVSTDSIHDTNSWLHRSVRGIEMVHTQSIDSNMRVSLTASQEYINGYSRALLYDFAVVYAVFIAAGAAVITAGAVYVRRKRTGTHGY